VYGNNAMSDGMVRKWVQMFNEGRQNVHDEVRSGHPSLVNDDLVRKVSPDLAPSDYHLFLHLKKFLGGKQFDDNDDLNDAVQKWLTSQAAAFYAEGIQNLWSAMISASIMAANMWKNSLKNVESDINKMLYETSLDFFTAKRYLFSE
jgi:hypothetical protein